MTPTTSFINVLVVVTPNDAGGYDSVCRPTKLVITQPDTIINYQIVDPTPEDIIFSGITVSGDKGEQMSTVSISTSARQAMLSDACTNHGVMNLNLEFTNRKGEAFSHDPEVENIPTPPP